MLELNIAKGSYNINNLQMQSNVVNHLRNTHEKVKRIKYYISLKDVRVSLKWQRNPNGNKIKYPAMSAQTVLEHME